MPYANHVKLYTFKTICVFKKKGKVNWFIFLDLRKEGNRKIKKNSLVSHLVIITHKLFLNRET